MDICDLNTYTLCDLQEEYKRLYALYQSSRKIHEEDLQQIHELQRSLKISKAAEDHLSQELDLISTAQNCDLEKFNKKLSQEIDELKKKSVESEEYNDILEKKIDTLMFENKKLQEHIHDITTTFKQEIDYNTNRISAEQIDKLQRLETENLNLVVKLNELQDELQKCLRLVAEKERQMEVLKEEVQCYQENLNAKRMELEEKSALYESLQERMSEMNSELASLKSKPENGNRKGNSLFAEVDDQRQFMKNQLLEHKKYFNQMKKTYNESQFEIRRLRRENSAMQLEIETCSSIFLNSRKFYEDKLNERISSLLKENSNLEKKLNINQERLKSLAEKKEITWLESLMTFCKNETEEIKEQLQNIRLQKEIVEKNYRDSQQELSKWRFEALKSRCILIDRESLLDENSIKYKNFYEMKVKISEEEILKSIPQIVNCHKKLTNINNDTNFANDIVLSKNSKLYNILPQKNQEFSSQESTEIDSCEKESSNKNIKIEPLEYNITNISPQIKLEPTHESFELNEETETFDSISKVKLQFNNLPNVNQFDENKLSQHIVKTKIKELDVSILTDTNKTKEEQKQNNSIYKNETNNLEKSKNMIKMEIKENITLLPQEITILPETLSDSKFDSKLSKNNSITSKRVFATGKTSNFTIKKIIVKSKGEKS